MNMKKRHQIYDTLAKLQKFSILPKQLSLPSVENSHAFFVYYTWYTSFSKRTHKKSSQAALQNGEQSSQSGAVASTLRPKMFKNDDPWHQNLPEN